MSDSLFDRLTAAFIFIGFTAFVFVLGWTGGETSGDGMCVPGYAVDYNGNLGAWLDRDGAVVLLAEEEDTYGWCTRP